MCRTHYRKLILYGDPESPNKTPGQPSKECSIKDCTNKHRAHGLCGLHNWRKNRYGAPENTRPTEIERFNSKYTKGKNCWIWQGNIGNDGYGKFITSIPKKTVRAHRYSWSLANGNIPVDMLVCHTCDVPLCVNPAHLFLGTPLDNTRDMIAKGRAKYTGIERKNPIDGRFISAH